jgi:hypothetical protein
MIIEFQTKAESNKRRHNAFLRLDKPVRFLKFLQMMDDFSIFPYKKTGNPHFKIEITMNFNETWGEKVKQFLKLAETRGVRMLLVDGGAVNFHGYQRHFFISAAGNLPALSGYGLFPIPDIHNP